MFLHLRGDELAEPDESVARVEKMWAERFTGESSLVAQPIRLLANTSTTSQVWPLERKQKRWAWGDLKCLSGMCCGFRFHFSFNTEQTTAHFSLLTGAGEFRFMNKKLEIQWLHNVSFKNVPRGLFLIILQLKYWICNNLPQEILGVGTTWTNDMSISNLIMPLTD